MEIIQSNLIFIGTQLEKIGRHHKVAFSFPCSNVVTASALKNLIVSQVVVDPDSETSDEQRFGKVDFDFASQ